VWRKRRYRHRPCVHAPEETGDEFGTVGIQQDGALADRIESNELGSDGSGLTVEPGVGERGLRRFAVLEEDVRVTISVPLCTQAEELSDGLRVVR
jgi:hypothetical protein